MPPQKSEADCCQKCRRPLAGKDRGRLVGTKLLCTSCYPSGRSTAVVAAVPEICGNCDAKIGRLETPYIFQGETVCKICYDKLSYAPADVRAEDISKEIDAADARSVRRIRSWPCDAVPHRPSVPALAMRHSPPSSASSE